MIEGVNHSLVAMIFGAVQGATEFLPISSSGHLLLLHSIIDVQNVNAQTFDVALHVGTLLALTVYFWRDIGQLIQAAWRWFRSPRSPVTLEQRLVWYLVLSAIPGALLGAAFESFFETAVRSVTMVAITLIVAGLGLWLADRLVQRRADLSTLNWQKALAMGLAQAAALIPGISRSGASMTMGRLLGLDRPAAARFSFLMAIPITAGAAIKKGYELFSAQPASAQLGDMVIGILISLMVGYIAIRFLLQFVSRHSYAVFAVYRVVLGVAVLLIVWLK